MEQSGVPMTTGFAPEGLGLDWQCRRDLMRTPAESCPRYFETRLAALERIEIAVRDHWDDLAPEIRLILRGILIGAALPKRSLGGRLAFLWSDIRLAWYSGRYPDRAAAYYLRKSAVREVIALSDTSTIDAWPAES